MRRGWQAREGFADELDQALHQLWQGDSSRLVALASVSSIGQIPSLLARASALPDSPTLAAGVRIGNYRIVRLIGRGGMGVVYEAEQLDPPRRVAIKFLRAGQCADDYEVGLFRREARTLARLQHPGIASLFELGSSGGQQFLVLEYVDGLPPDRWVSELCPDRDARIEVFLSVCEAVAHAHERGVLHRDLKPSNILVDRTGRPRVLDFGLARIVAADSDQETLITRAGMNPGTLPYMAPEQVRGENGGIDARTDVHALGILLFKLLTEQLPYDLHGRSDFEIARIIAEKPVLRPCRLVRGIDSDLETIMLKALEKDPARRYGMVRQFASDLRRWQQGLPVEARPPSTFYLLRTHLRRHRLAVALVATAILGLSATVIALLIGLLGTRAAEQLARDEANKASAVQGFLTEILSGADPALSGREDVTAREMLDAAALKLATGRVSEPGVEASIRVVLGRSYRSLGRLEEARLHLARALHLRSLVHASPHIELAESLRELGVLEHTLTRYEAAEPLLRAALEMRAGIHERGHPLLRQSRSDLGWLLHNAGRVEEAARLFEENVAVARLIRRPDILRSTLVEQGDFLLQSRRHHEAIRVLQEATRGADGEQDPRLASRSLEKLGLALHSAGRTAEGIARLEEALELRQQMLGGNHLDVADNHYYLGKLEQGRREFEAARRHLRTALGIRQLRLGENHVLTFTVRTALASLMGEMGDAAGAEAELRSGIEEMRGALGDDHVDVGNALRLLGHVLLNAGRKEAARQPLAQAVAVLEPKLGVDHSWVVATRSLLLECDSSGPDPDRLR